MMFLTIGLSVRLLSAKKIIWFLKSCAKIILNKITADKEKFHNIFAYNITTITTKFLENVGMLEELKKIISAENVDEETRRCFPNNREEAINVVKWAYARGEKIRAVSTDNNWGYNTFIKNDFPGLTLNLSKLNRIIDFDKKTGVVTIEPGVTQGQLKKFLDDNKSDLVTPTTGAGPSCSIMGNVLERGYGVTAYYDSFASCMSLEAVWRNGEIYRSPLISLGGNDVHKLYKWGVGPFFDGLFAQSDYGICTSMSVALKRRPSGVMGVMFQLNKSPATLVPAIRALLQSIGGLMGPMKVTNQHRIVSLMHMAPELRSLASPLADHLQVQQFFSQCRIPLWHGFFAVYTDKSILPGVRNLLSGLIEPLVDDIRFVEDGAFQHPQDALFIDQITGTPSDKSLVMAYLRAPEFPKPYAPFSPEKDGAGILWFAPLIPAKSESVEKYLQIAHKILGEFGFDSAISFTSLSDRCFDSVLALLFNSHDEKDIARAKSCYLALFEQCKAEGFVPYRIPHCFDYLTKDDRLKTEKSLAQIFAQK